MTFFDIFGVSQTKSDNFHIWYDIIEKNEKGGNKMGIKYNMNDVYEKINALPKEKDIFKLETGLDIVIHEFLEDLEAHKGTIFDIKDLPKQTIYRVRFEGGVYTIEVIVNSPKSTVLNETFSTVSDAINHIVNLINA